MPGDEQADIEGRIERLEEIAEILEEGEVGLATAKDLREEADVHLRTLREALDVGEGDIIEIDADAGAASDAHAASDADAHAASDADADTASDADADTASDADAVKANTDAGEGDAGPGTGDATTDDQR